MAPPFLCFWSGLRLVPSVCAFVWSETHWEDDLCVLLARVLQVQLTEFENAAFTVFVVLLTRAIISYQLNFYIPLSKVGTVFSSSV